MQNNDFTPSVRPQYSFDNFKKQVEAISSGYQVKVDGNVVKIYSNYQQITLSSGRACIASNQGLINYINFFKSQYELVENKTRQTYQIEL